MWGAGSRAATSPFADRRPRCSPLGRWLQRDGTGHGAATAPGAGPADSGVSAPGRSQAGGGPGPPREQRGRRGALVLGGSSVSVESCHDTKAASQLLSPVNCRGLVLNTSRGGCSLREPRLAGCACRSQGSGMPRQRLVSVLHFVLWCREHSGSRSAARALPLPFLFRTAAVVQTEPKAGVALEPSLVFI